MSQNSLSTFPFDFIPNAVQNGVYNDPYLGPINPDTVIWNRQIEWGGKATELTFLYAFHMPEADRIALGNLVNAFIKQAPQMAEELLAFVFEEVLKIKTCASYFRLMFGPQNLRKDLQSYLCDFERPIWIFIEKNGKVGFNLHLKKSLYSFISVSGNFDTTTGLSLTGIEVSKKRR